MLSISYTSVAARFALRAHRCNPNQKLSGKANHSFPLPEYWFQYNDKLSSVYPETDTNGRLF